MAIPNTSTPGLPLLSVGNGTSDGKWSPSVGAVVNATELQGTPVSATTPTTGQLLEFNGTDWIPMTLTPGVVSNAVIGVYVVNQVILSGGSLSGVSGLTYNVSGYSAYLVSTTLVMVNNDTAARTGDIQIQVGGSYYGNQVALTIAAGGNVQFATSAAVTGLSPGTVYSFNTLATIGGAVNATARNAELTIIGIY